MKRGEDEKGNLVRVFENGDGMRRRFYDAIEDSRFTYPRRVACKHAYPWYCDGHLSGRPVNGIWACALLAEHMLSLAKGRRARRPGLLAAVTFYASTRRAMRHLLAHYKVTSRLTRPGVRRALSLYLKLCEEGTALLRETGYLTPTTGV